MGLLKENYLHERVVLGQVYGVSHFMLRGYNGATTTTAEVVWPESATYTFLAANMTTPKISSSDTNDAAAGSGARTVYITGVDANYAAQSETLTLNGQTGVALVNNYMTINSMEVLTAGSGGVNAGNIYVGTGTITAGKPAVVHSILSTVNPNVAVSYIYAVPANKTLLIIDLTAGSVSTTVIGNELVIDTSVNKDILKRVWGVPTRNVNTFDNSFTSPIKFAEKTQLKLSVSAASGTGPFYAQSNCWLIDNDSNFLGV